MIVWGSLAIVAAIVEVSIAQFGVIFVSLAAVTSAAVAFLGLGLATQIMILVVVLAASLAPAQPGNRAATQQWGIKVMRIELKNITPRDEIRLTMESR